MLRRPQAAVRKLCRPFQKVRIQFFKVQKFRQPFLKFRIKQILHRNSFSSSKRSKHKKLCKSESLSEYKHAETQITFGTVCQPFLKKGIWIFWSRSGIYIYEKFLTFFVRKIPILFCKTPSIQRPKHSEIHRKRKSTNAVWAYCRWKTISSNENYTIQVQM